MSKYFPKPKSSTGNVKVKLDQSIYTTKTGFKKATVVDTSHFAKKDDLNSLKIRCWKIRCW